MLKPGFMAGLRCVGAGLLMLPKAKVRRFVAIPVILNVLLFVIAFNIAGNAIDRLLDHDLPAWLTYFDWIAALVELLVWIVFGAAALLLTFFGFTLLANFIGAPFNGFLSEAVASKLGNTPTSGAFQWQRLPVVTASALLGELQKLAYFAIRAIPLLLLFLIPGLQFLAPLIWFVFGAWAMAVEYLDYPLGNADMRFSDQLDLLRQRRRLMLGFGAGVALMTSIPGLNFIAMPTAVAGATVLWHRHLATA